MTGNTRPPKFIESFIPIVVLILLLAFNVYVFSDDATGGPNQIALLLGAVIAAGIGLGQGFSWKAIQVKSVSPALARCDVSAAGFSYLFGNNDDHNQGPDR